jgi:hypothetical protein
MGDIISCLNHETVTGETLRLLFERILVYEPGELDRETGEALGLSAPDCQQIADRGGLVFLTRMAP